MATISVPYRVLVEDVPPAGPTVRYLVRWADAFVFFDEVLGRTPPPGVVPPVDMRAEPAGQVVATHGEIEPRGMTKTPEGVSFADAIVTVTYGVFPISPAFPKAAQAGA